MKPDVFSSCTLFLAYTRNTTFNNTTVLTSKELVTYIVQYALYVYICTRILLHLRRLNPKPSDIYGIKG